MKFISSRDNPTYKHLKAQGEDARYRRQTTATLIDGEHLLQAALEAGCPLTRLVLSEDVVETAPAQAVLRRAKAADAPPQEILVLAPGLFKALSPVVTPTGLLAEIAVPATSAPVQPDADVLALAGVQDAGNLGTLLRTAAAAGVRQVWLDAQTTQAWSPKALRAGMGAQFQLAIQASCDLPDLMAQHGGPSYVTHLGASSTSLFAQDLRAPCIWIFGAEGQGVPADLVARATHRVVIPMPGQIESLNVAAAAAICLFEQVRQRLSA